MSPNLWGDFFAGLFAPLAFFWLVVGYFQQGDELRLSTQALRLQAQELSNSVEQQRALVDASLRHLADLQRARQAQTYARLAAKFNSPRAGKQMEHVGRWLTLHSNVSAMEISQAYLEHLRNLEQRGLNTKDDPLEASRRALKSWFLDCHREYRFGNLLTDHLFALLTKDRARIMTAVFIMTRAQTYGWQVNSNLPEQERGSSDEADFVALEQVVADKYGFPPPQPSGSLESALRAHALLLRPDNGVQNNAPPAARV